MLKVKFHGHACFEISDGKNNLIIDPWLTGNPQADVKAEDIKTDYILVTHGHGDHFGDAIGIAKSNDAVIIAPFELATFCQHRGIEKVHPMHIGGGYNFDFGRVKLTNALHGGGYVEDNHIYYLGNPCGFIIEIGAKTIYHAGDTGLFGDMKLIGEMNSLDLALLPIGDNFVMGIDDAVKAVEFLKPVKTVPMHYNTFDLIKQDPEQFKNKVAGKSEVIIMNPGDEIEL
ncbi:MAG: hypothetical protein PWQ82_127 [Thermosediminibacterales bacterium]|nr:hypothetical protein [Thermosediminibacterales bacterium]MDK2836430.1 hypothetical protein [Thermosediminibacterales bacterium]